MFENMKIFVLGMARSGYEVSKILAKRKNEVILNDIKKEQDEEHIRELEEFGVKLYLGTTEIELIDDSIDYIVKNPGIKDTNEIIVKAKELGIPVINEIELCYNLLPEGVTLIGITGSNGKTTTTSLIYEILKNASLPVVLAGNIGYPLSSVINTVKENDILLMEISIQQLCNFDKFKTNISVLTNIYDAHLDFVGNKENYINIKKRIFNHHTKDDYAILNYDNEITKNISDIMSHIEYFSKANDNALCHIKDNSIYYDDKKFISTNELLLKGNHNYENVMAAIMVAKRLNVSDEIIVNTLKEFSGVEHRIEFVRDLNGVKVYNDSKATNVKATEIALNSFNEPTILLLGGLDRGHSFDDLIPHMKNVKLVVSYGQTKDRIKDWCNNLNVDCIVTSKLKEATEIAIDNSIKGDVILLSPACASWDQYKDFEERGRVFKKYINNK